MVVTIGNLNQISEHASEDLRSFRFFFRCQDASYPFWCKDVAMHRERLSPTLPETQMSRCWLSGGPEGQYDMATRSLFCGQHVNLLSQDGQGWPLCNGSLLPWQILGGSPNSHHESKVASLIKQATGQSCRPVKSSLLMSAIKRQKSKTEPLHPTAVISGLPTPFPTMTVLDQHRWPHTSPGTTASPSAWNIFRGAENCWGPNQGCYSSCPSTQPPVHMAQAYTRLQHCLEVNPFFDVWWWGTSKSHPGTLSGESWGSKVVLSLLSIIVSTVLSFSDDRWAHATTSQGKAGIEMPRKQPEKHHAPGQENGLKQPRPRSSLMFSGPNSSSIRPLILRTSGFMRNYSAK